MMTFFRDPDAATFQTIREAVDRHTATAGIEPPNAIPAVAFLSAAAEAYGYELPGESRTLRAARAVVAGDTSDRWAAFILGDTRHPTGMDVWWSRFFATGDVESIRRVLRQIDPDVEKPVPADGKTPDRSKVLGWAMSEAAKWSFNSLGRQLPEVAGFAVTALVEEEFEPIKPFLLISLAGKKISADAVEKLRSLKTSPPTARAE